MAVRFAMPAAFVAAGAACRNAYTELAFQHLAACPGFRSRDDRAGCQADCGAIEALPDGAEQPIDAALGQASVGARGARPGTVEAGLHAVAHRIGVRQA